MDKRYQNDRCRIKDRAERRSRIHQTVNEGCHHGALATLAGLAGASRQTGGAAQTGGMAERVAGKGMR